MLVRRHLHILANQKQHWGDKNSKKFVQYKLYQRVDVYFKKKKKQDRRFLKARSSCK